jgi:hypothetical protein
VYQASQQNLVFGRGFLQEHQDDSLAVMQTMLDQFRDGFFGAFRAERRPESEIPPDEEYRKPLLTYSDLSLSGAKAAELISRLKEIAKELDDAAAAEDPEGIPAHLLIGCFVPPEAPDS